MHPFVVKVNIEVVVELGAIEVEVLANVFPGCLEGPLLVNPILRMSLLAARAVAPTLLVYIIFLLLGEPLGDEESHELVAGLSGVPIWNILALLGRSDSHSQ